MKFCWNACLILLFALPLRAQTTNSAPVAAAPKPAADPFSDPLIQQVSERHRKAVEGDAVETKKLTADLEKWTAQHPENHLLQAYLGSTYTLDSRDAWPGPGKLTYLRNGGRLLDAAVAADPTNPAVRFVRAIDYFELPMIFGKRGTARQDFQILVRQIEGQSPMPYTPNVETAQAIYYYAGLSLRQQWRTPEAVELWQRGLKLDAASPLAAKIRAELAKVK